MKNTNLISAFVLFATLCGYHGSSSAQTQPDSTSNSSTSLRPQGKTILSIPGALAGKARCDDTGNVYLRLMDAQLGEDRRVVSKLPVLKIQPDGSVAKNFDLATISADLKAIAYFVKGDGTVYFAARSDRTADVYVVTFPSGSSSPLLTRLQTDFFVPYQIVVFNSGEYLLSGIMGSYNRVPFTALFSPTGKLVKAISEPEDDDSRKRAEAGEIGYRPPDIEFGNEFISRGDSGLGSDGNAYLLRASGLVFVVSNSGQVIRKIQVGSPAPGMTASVLKALSGKLVIAFLNQRSTQGSLKVVDLDGRTLQTHAPSQPGMYPGLMACATPQGYTFLGIDENKRVYLSKVGLE